MIEEIVSGVFRKIGHVWRAGDKYIWPEEDDVRRVLDSAAARLYDSDTDTRLETGGLIIEKRPKGYSVYVYVGDYE